MGFPNFKKSHAGNMQPPGVGLTLSAEFICKKTSQLNVVFSISNHPKCLSWLFPIHLNTYVMGLRPLEIFLLLQVSDSNDQRLNPHDALKHHFASLKNDLIS